MDSLDKFTSIFRREKCEKMIGYDVPEEQFLDRIVGEVSNNGTAPADYVEPTVSFYDGSGQIVGTKSGYADPHTIQPGSKAPSTGTHNFRYDRESGADI